MQADRPAGEKSRTLHCDVRTYAVTGTALTMADCHLSLSPTRGGSVPRHRFADCPGLLVPRVRGGPERSDGAVPPSAAPLKMNAEGSVNDVGSLKAEG
jgi:hypothetical protein